MGKETGKKTNIYIYIRLNHFGVRLKLTQHCKLAILHKKYILCLDMTI